MKNNNTDTQTSQMLNAIRKYGSLTVKDAALITNMTEIQAAPCLSGLKTRKILTATPVKINGKLYLSYAISNDPSTQTMVLTPTTNAPKVGISDSMAIKTRNIEVTFQPNDVVESLYRFAMGSPVTQEKGVGTISISWKATPENIKHATNLTNAMRTGGKKVAASVVEIERIESVNKTFLQKI